MIQWTPEQYGKLERWMGRIEAEMKSLSIQMDAHLKHHNNNSQNHPKPRLPVYVVPGGAFGTGIGLAIWAIIEKVTGG